MLKQVEGSIMVPFLPFTNGLKEKLIVALRFLCRANKK
jgi:hypothetical protein